MKIAQIDVNYQASSTGKIVADLVTSLHGKGHSTLTCFGRGKDSGIQGVYKTSSDAEVAFHALATRVTGLTGCFSPIATRRVIDLLRDFSPDVVHLHELHGYYLNIGAIVSYLKSTATPTLWTFHSEFMYTGKCGYALECEKWKSACDRCPQLREYPKSWFFDFTAEMFQEKRHMFEGFDHLHLVAPSIWLADRMAASVVVRGKPISVVHNGLDVSVFNRRDVRATRARLGLSDEFVVLSVGSNLLSELKGGRWALELAKRNPDMTFVLVGADSIPPSLPNNVRVIKRVYDQELLAEYYSMADVLLLTSAKETFSMVSAESLACGTPVVGFDSGAPKEVAPTGFGEFVPHGDLAGLESLIRRARAKTLPLRTPQQCRAFAVSRYGKDVMVNAYENIYRRLAGEC